MSIWEKLKRARTLSQVYDVLEEAQKVGKLRLVLVALGAAISVAIVAKVTDACPALTSQWQSMIFAAGGAAFMLVRQKVSAGEAFKTALIGSFGVAVGDQLAQVCGAAFLQQLPTYLTAGVWMGIGHFLDHPAKAPEEPKE